MDAMLVHPEVHFEIARQRHDDALRNAERRRLASGRNHLGRRRAALAARRAHDGAEAGSASDRYEIQVDGGASLLSVAEGAEGTS